jgi:hypothetical protein
MWYPIQKPLVGDIFHIVQDDLQNQYRQSVAPCSWPRHQPLQLQLGDKARPAEGHSDMEHRRPVEDIQEGLGELVHRVAAAEADNLAGRHRYLLVEALGCGIYQAASAGQERRVVAEEPHRCRKGDDREEYLGSAFAAVEQARSGKRFDLAAA